MENIDSEQETTIKMDTPDEPGYDEIRKN